MDLEQRKAISQTGANYSASTKRWIGFLYDGRVVQNFEPRMTRDRALLDARQHWDRVFREERPVERWTPQT